MRLSYIDSKNVNPFMGIDPGTAQSESSAITTRPGHSMMFIFTMQIPQFPDIRISKHQKTCFKNQMTWYPDNSKSGHLYVRIPKHRIVMIQYPDTWSPKTWYTDTQIRVLNFRILSMFWYADSLGLCYKTYFSVVGRNVYGQNISVFKAFSICMCITEKQLLMSFFHS